MNSVAACLGVLFVALKLTHHIDWDWIWVTAPFWAPVVLALLFMIAAAIGYIIMKVSK